MPALFFAPFAGSFVDRFSLKRMMVITNLLQSFTVFLYLFARDNIFLLYSLVFLYSALDQLYLPAQQASIPWLVEKEHLSSANGIFFLTQQASFLVGFGLVGLFLFLLGRNITIIFSCLALFMAALAVSRLPRDKTRLKSTIRLDKFFLDFREGYEHITSHPQTKMPLILIVAFQVFITILSVLLPTYTLKILGLNLEHAGILLIIPGALGALIFTRTLPLTLKANRKKTVIESGLLIGAFSLAIMSVLGFLGSFKVSLSVLTAVGLGISVASVIIPSQTLLQEKTPSDLRGRTYSVLGFLMTLSTAIPMLVIATLSDIFGIGAIIGLMSILLMAGFLFIKYRADYVLANGSWI